METGAVEHAMVIEDGDVLELDGHDARKYDKVTAGRILIDSGSAIDVVEDLVIRDRRVLSEDGIVLAVLAINKRIGKVERRTGSDHARLRRRGHYRPSRARRSCARSTA